MKKSKQKLILKLHSEVRRKLRWEIEETFPKLFKPRELPTAVTNFAKPKLEIKVEAGNWYERPGFSDSLIYITEVRGDGHYGGVGICKGDWTDNYDIYVSPWDENENYKLTPADWVFVQPAIVAEAQHRGFLRNGSEHCLRGSSFVILNNFSIVWVGEALFVVDNKNSHYRNCIYDKGLWAIPATPE